MLPRVVHRVPRTRCACRTPHRTFRCQDFTLEGIFGAKPARKTLSYAFIPCVLTPRDAGPPLEVEPKALSFKPSLNNATERGHAGMPKPQSSA